MRKAALLKAQAFIVIIRAVHERGESQRLALEVLKERGLWLSADQRKQAALD